MNHGAMVVVAAICYLIATVTFILAITKKMDSLWMITSVLLAIGSFLNVTYQIISNEG